MLFSESGMENLVAYVFPENAASIRVLEKKGMNKIGEIQNTIIYLKKYKESIVFNLKRS
jgi:Acetyltransferases, including N-acetylases of ribosomal proteins